MVVGTDSQTSFTTRRHGSDKLNEKQQNQERKGVSPEIAQSGANGARTAPQIKTFRSSSEKVQDGIVYQCVKRFAFSESTYRRIGKLVDKFVFFFHAIPPDRVALTLEELHSLIRDIWLTRHDSQLEDECLARRKGRPKSTKEMKLEALKEAELEEYRTGMGEYLLTQ